MLGLGEALALSTAGIWASATLFYRIALTELSPVRLALLRALSASLALLAPCLIFSFPELVSLDLLSLGFVLSSAILISAGDICYFESVKRSGLWIATPLSSVYPLFVTLIAYIFLKETITGSQIGGVIFIVLGVSLIARRPSAEGYGGGGRIGAALALIAAVWWALSLVTLRIALLKAPVLPIVTVRMILVSAVLGLMSITRNNYKIRFPVSRRMLYVALVSGVWGIGFGSFLFFSSMDLIGAAKATAISATYPLFTGLLGTLVLKERMTIGRLVGAISVTAGLVLLV